jgi:hypothetical protein
MVHTTTLFDNRGWFSRRGGFETLPYNPHASLDLIKLSSPEIGWGGLPMAWGRGFERRKKELAQLLNLIDPLLRSNNLHVAAQNPP